ncbi:MAG: hypothetical protein A3K66_03975 [Euryarchaeota archaeon RBG_16_67_27]|nr:MAG: hypothetical protein A3K66_03975 [Euryarchaeota archaeon RBG_16_67_27]
MALGLFWLLNIVVSGASAVFLGYIVSVYARSARAVRSPFTLGLLAFGILFLAQSLLAIAAYVGMNDAGMPSDVAIPMLWLNGAGLAAVVALFGVTWR